MNGFRVILHGVFGAVFGAAAGLATWALGFPEVNPALMVALPTLIVAVVAAIWGDRFWRSLKDSGWWNPFNWM